MRELLGELAALHPDRDQFEAAAYDHDNPAVAFNELAQKIRGLLRGSVAARFLSVAFTRAEKTLVAALSDEHLNVPNEYFLGIKTKDDPRAVAMLVEDADKFKLMAKSTMDHGMAAAKRLQNSAYNTADSYARAIKNAAEEIAAMKPAKKVEKKPAKKAKKKSA